MDELIVKPVQRYFVTFCAHFFRDQEVNGTLQVCVSLVIGVRVIGSLFVEADDLIRGLTERIDVLRSDQFGDLDVGAVHRSEGDCAVQHELHVGCAGCLFGCQGDLFGDIRCRDQLFRQ